MTNPSEAEVDAACQVGGKMLEAALTPGGKPIKVIEIFRAALTAAAQVRERESEKEEIVEYERTRRAWGLQSDPVQAPTEPAEASRDHPGDIAVRCLCGWRGKQSELVFASAGSVIRTCPKCADEFASWPPPDASGPTVEVSHSSDGGKTWGGTSAFRLGGKE